MRERILLSFFVPVLVVLFPLVARQANSMQGTANKTGPEQHWTEGDRQQFLAKAQRGDAQSQMWLAAAYEQGWFGKANIPEALKWYRKSAAKGNPDAQNALGLLYEDGEGVRQSYDLAAKWYRKDEEHVPDFGGAGQGRNHLGLLYLDGHGVPKDYLQAYMWFSLSGGEQNANLTYAKERMTHDQILKAERRVEEWKRRHNESARLNKNPEIVTENIDLYRTARQS